MPIYKRFSQGRPFWSDLTSPDVDVSMEFYSHLFGWEYEDEIPEPENRNDTRNVWAKNPTGYTASISNVAMSHTSAHWKVLLAVEDMDQVVERARDNGGHLANGPFTVADLGRSAEVIEPGGTILHLWQSFGPSPVVQHEHGALQWSEVMTNDPAKTTEFFRSAFQVETAPMEMGDGSVNSLVLVEEGPIMSISALDGLSEELIERSDGPIWVNYFNINDVDSAVQRAVQHGAELPDPPWDVPGVGRMAWIYDPHGALLGLITPEG